MRLFLPLFLLLAGTGSLPAQSSVTITDPASCRNCAIALTVVARLGSPDDPAGVAMFAGVAVDSRGRYAAASPVNIGEILIYDASGRFVRTLGRRGGGPGEFQSLTKLRFGPGDSLHVVEEGTGRYTVFSPSLEHARSVTFPGRAFGFVLGAAGRIIAVAPSAAGDRQVVMQVFAPSGERLTAFEEMPATESASPGAGRRHVALDREGGVWTVRPDRYEIRSYDAQGAPRAVYRATREWISGEPLPLRMDPATRPPSQIGGIAIDDAGLVWVFAVVPDVNWRPLQPQAGPPEPSKIYDTLIEVFDPRSGVVVAHTRVDHLVFPLRSGQVYGIVPQASGEHQIQVWSTTLPATR